jgi:CubicO group peptidase (beta-lactamase class C family)
MNQRMMRLIALVITLVAFSFTAADDTPWPSQDWGISTPEAQQVDAAVLDRLDQEIASGKHGYVDGMMVYRNGYLVYRKTYDNDYKQLFVGRDQSRWQYNYYDPDWHPWFKASQLHSMQSVSKSVTSALVGIAIGRGEIPGVDVEVMSYFDDYDPVDKDPRRDAITLRDLLTMTSGIEWDESTVDYTDPRNTCAAMERSEDWVRFVLDQPMRALPGEEFEYNSGVTVLLAHILLKATGKHVDEYAVDHLFGPLGIDAFYWKKTPTGLVDTEGGLYLEPQDLAKFGHLYESDGIWNDQRILPEGWVAASMEPNTEVPNRPGTHYGYQWWLLPYEGEKQNWAYTGLGYGGQYLLVVPEYDLIAVFTGWNIYDERSLGSEFALEQVLNAVR